MPSSPAAAGPPFDYTAARQGRAHRFRDLGVLEVTGEERVGFLQGQLTQDVTTLSEGETRSAAGLTPKGKLLFTARLIGLSDRLRLLVPVTLRDSVRTHLAKYAVFQKAAIEDRSGEFMRVGLYGAAPPDLLLPEALLLPGEGEFASEVLLPRSLKEAAERALSASGSTGVSGETSEILRVEAGRPRFGQDMDESHLPDEIGLDTAISTTKGCYVGQEIVARLRTYGRVNKRLVGYLFPDGVLRAGTPLCQPGEGVAGKIEWGRVTSAAVSPRYGPIGMGFAFRDVPMGGRLVAAGPPERSALVVPRPFV